MARIQEMEDSFLHPTAVAPADSSDTRFPTIVEENEATAAMDATTTLNIGKEMLGAKDAAPTFETLPRESGFMQGYTSDEEAPSPVDSDDLSIRSLDSDSDVEIFEASHASPPSPKQTQTHSNSPKHRCNHAQTVTFIPAGSAKVVSMHKLASMSNGLSAARARRRSSLKPPVSRLSRMELAEHDVDVRSIDDDKSSSRSSSEKSSPSTAPSSVAESEPSTMKDCRRPSTPLLNGAASQYSLRPTTSSRTTSSRATTAPTGLFKDDPNSPLEYSLPTPKAKQTPSPQRKPRQSTSFFNLSRFGKGLARSNTTTTPSPRKPSVSTTPPPRRTAPIPPPPTPTQPTTALPSLPLSDPSRPTSSSASRARMTARGASYRAPTLELPPCPHEVDGDFEGFVRGGPTRKFSAPVYGMQEQRPESSSGKLHKRQRVVSLVPRSTVAV